MPKPLQYFRKKKKREKKKKKKTEPLKFKSLKENSTFIYAYIPLTFLRLSFSRR